MSKNDLVWVPGFDDREGEYVPMRQYRRYTTVKNSFESRILCQQECDRRNTKYERPSPSVLIPERRHQ
jgi:hypothetical protein